MRFKAERILVFGQIEKCHQQSCSRCFYSVKIVSGADCLFGESSKFENSKCALGFSSTPHDTAHLKFSLWKRFFQLLQPNAMLQFSLVPHVAGRKSILKDKKM